MRLSTCVAQRSASIFSYDVHVDTQKVKSINYNTCTWCIIGSEIFKNSVRSAYTCNMQYNQDHLDYKITSWQYAILSKKPMKQWRRTFNVTGYQLKPACLTIFKQWKTSSATLFDGTIFFLNGFRCRYKTTWKIKIQNVNYLKHVNSILNKLHFFYHRSDFFRSFLIWLTLYDYTHGSNR